ncbi:MAG: DUF2567 domain-containing protein [Gordonia sp. (in: high G+C Gram-positive bacteria)]
MIGVVLLLGVVAGGAWTALTPAVGGERTGDGLVLTGVGWDNEFAGVGAFALIMFVYGAVAALVSWFAAPGWRGPTGYGFALAATALGTGVAGRVGTWLADWRFRSPDAATALGETFRVVPDLWLDGATRGAPSGPWILVICAPLAATISYLICTLAIGRGDLGVGDGEPVAPVPDDPASPGGP